MYSMTYTALAYVLYDLHGSLDYSLFVLLYNTNFVNKLKFNVLFNLKTNNNELTVQIFLNIQNHPAFCSEERW